MHITKVTALVTGAASGLGRATASRLLRQGARVVLADLPHTEAAATTLLSEVGASANQHGAFSPVDVLDESMVKAALDSAEKRWGGPVNVVVNCAGILMARRVVSKKGVHPLDSFLKTLHINTGGTFNTIRLAAERLQHFPADSEGHRGVFINTASTAAYEGQIGNVAYAASKGAVVGMTLPLARDLAKLGIRVMAIAPGYFHTPILDNLPDEAKKALTATVPFPSRLGDPEEYAQLVQSIIENNFLNGEVIRLDGACRMTASS